MEIRNLVVSEVGETACKLIEQYISLSSSDTVVLDTATSFNIDALNVNNASGVINLHKVNDINKINDVFVAANNKLEDKGIFIGTAETLPERKKRILNKYPSTGRIYYFLDFIFKRIFPKLWFTKSLYHFITADRNRAISKAEILGRLIFCGFTILQEEEINNRLFFIAQKTEKYQPKPKPPYGLIFKMNRIGYYGHTISIYKLRTMHPYAEYLQEYIYRKYDLKDGGKFKNDFRITEWGHVLRAFWIDELPMLYNLIKGELKLVGVRPLSKHYLSLYSKELIELRSHFKPGLVPPFYLDLPNNLNEIMASETRYLLAYSKTPIQTNFKYFFGALKNIVFRKVRSN